MKLLRLLGMLGVIGVLVLLVNTVVGFSKGTGPVSPSGPGKELVNVRVDSCARVGPLHDWRLGFYWVCQVQVEGGDRLVVDRSILTDEDVGRTVKLYQACYQPPNAHCTLGEEVFPLVGAGIAILRWTERLLVFFLACWGFTYLLAAVAGPRRFLDFIAWWSRPR
ncbi:MAG TPA: DUF6346 domain-containing protein [Actinoplanes sp.]|nr:DUF6346 domain-containing protein [Actinoplanes sp.]